MKLVERKTHELNFHPLLQRIPELPYDCEERQALKESLRSHGLKQPLLVQGREIIDGRHRYDAAMSLNWQTIACVEVEGPVVDVILDSVAQRRHFSKGALAWMAYPLLESYIQAGVERRIEHLKQYPNENGGSTVGALSATTGKASEIVAKKIGVSARLMRQAGELEDILAKNGETMSTNGQETFREWAERVVFIGEEDESGNRKSMGLGRVIAGLAGKESVIKGIQQKGLRKRSQRHEQIIKHFQGTHQHFTYWIEMEPEARIEVLNAIPEQVVNWPNELLVRLDSEIKKVLRARV